MVQISATLVATAASFYVSLGCKIYLSGFIFCLTVRFLCLFAVGTASAHGGELPAALPL